MSAECMLCPEGGFCSGSFDVQPKRGYWTASVETYLVYKATPNSHVHKFATSAHGALGLGMIVAVASQHATEPFRPILNSSGGDVEGCLGGIFVDFPLVFVLFRGKRRFRC